MVTADWRHGSDDGWGLDWGSTGSSARFDDHRGYYP